MPPQPYLAVFELFMRHGVDPAQTKLIGMNELRNRELKDVDTIFKMAKRPNRDFYLSGSAKGETDVENSGDGEESPFSFEKWWPSLLENPKRWVSPPQEMMERSVREEAAMCV
jgi:hypothetical protein